MYCDDAPLQGNLAPTKLVNTNITDQLNTLPITLTNCELICPIGKTVIKLSKFKEIMDTLNTQQAEQAIKRFKQWVRAFETAQELFPELESKQWTTLADCLDEAINNR